MQFQIEHLCDGCLQGAPPDHIIHKNQDATSGLAFHPRCNTMLAQIEQRSLHGFPKMQQPVTTRSWEEECIGCESGAEGGHDNPDETSPFSYHPACQTALAEMERYRIVNTKEYQLKRFSEAYLKWLMEKKATSMQVLQMLKDCSSIEIEEVELLKCIAHLMAQERVNYQPIIRAIRNHVVTTPILNYANPESTQQELVQEVGRFLGAVYEKFSLKMAESMVKN